MASATLQYPLGMGTTREDEFRIDINDEALPRPVTSHSAVEDDYAIKVRKAAERLALLKNEAQELERERLEYQALAEKQQEFARSRVEVEDSLNKGLISVEREAAEARRRMQLCLDAREDYARHLDLLKGIRPDEWHRSELVEQLDNALLTINSARLDHERTEAQLSPYRQAAGGMGGSALSLPDFKTCLRAGFAFSIPVIAAILLGTIIAVIF
jgi:hypothetical protein